MKIQHVLFILDGIISGIARSAKMTHSFMKNGRDENTSNRANFKHH